MTTIFVKVMELLNCSAIEVFVHAFDFFEVRITPDDLNNTFNACCKEVEGKTTLMTVPRGVMLYCIEAVTMNCMPLREDSQLPPLEIWGGEVRGEK